MKLSLGRITLIALTGLFCVLVWRQINENRKLERLADAYRKEIGNLRAAPQGYSPARGLAETGVSDPASAGGAAPTSTADLPAGQRRSPVRAASEGPRPEYRVAGTDQYFQHKMRAPTSASMSLFAATMNKDALYFSQAIALDEAAKAKVMAFIEQLPAATRAQVRSPEQLLGSVFARWLWKDEEPRAGTKIKAIPEPGGERVRVSTQQTFASGVTKEVVQPFVRDGDRWLYGPLTEKDVGEMLASIDPITGTPVPSPAK